MYSLKVFMCARRVLLFEEVILFVVLGDRAAAGAGVIVAGQGGGCEAVLVHSDASGEFEATDFAFDVERLGHNSPLV